MFTSPIQQRVHIIFILFTPKTFQPCFLYHQPLTNLLLAWRAEGERAIFFFRHHDKTSTSFLLTLWTFSALGLLFAMSLLSLRC